MPGLSTRKDTNSHSHYIISGENQIRNDKIINYKIDIEDNKVSQGFSFSGHPILNISNDIKWNFDCIIFDKDHNELSSFCDSGSCVNGKNFKNAIFNSLDQNVHHLYFEYLSDTEFNQLVCGITGTKDGENGLYLSSNLGFN